MKFPLAKGHGTQNDFVVLPDLDGALHGDRLDPDLIVALCDRRRGIGADGVLRVLRDTESTTAPWFMDYYNADGSISEMCGNGIRVFARYLVIAGLINVTRPLFIDTRDGVKAVSFCPDGEISVDMGVPAVGDLVKVAVDSRSYAARAVDMGNPHAVAFVDTLDEAGDLEESPEFESTDFPEGVNIEFAVLRGPGSVAMRVFERGVGETASCGTGACAVAAAVAVQHATSLPASYRVEVPGGVLTVTWDERRHMHLKGPAVVVARGTWLQQPPRAALVDQKGTKTR